jgi:hypothetical protein
MVAISGRSDRQRLTHVNGMNVPQLPMGPYRSSSLPIMLQWACMRSPGSAIGAENIDGQLGRASQPFQMINDLDLARNNVRIGRQMALNGSCCLPWVDPVLGLLVDAA